MVICLRASDQGCIYQSVKITASEFDSVGWSWFSFATKVLFTCGPNDKYEQGSRDQLVNCVWSHFLSLLQFLKASTCVRLTLSKVMLPN